jgi:hypothetical protein
MEERRWNPVLANRKYGEGNVKKKTCFNHGVEAEYFSETLVFNNS